MISTSFTILGVALFMVVPGILLAFRPPRLRDHLIWCAAFLIVSLVFGLFTIGIKFVPSFKNRFVGYAVATVFWLLYILSHLAFLVFLNDLESRFDALIVSMHAMTCYLSLFICAAIDSYKFCGFLGHFIYLAIEFITIVVTIVIEPHSWPIVVSFPSSSPLFRSHARFCTT